MEQKPQLEPPPRAFTQGVGTVFQFAGGILFIALSLACCGSGLLGKETWKREDLMRSVGRKDEDPNDPNAGATV